MAKIDRTKGIGGTDIGAIVGVNPWRGIMDIYLEKIGITESQPDNEAMYWGREMEPVLLKRYVKETGETAVFVPQPDELPYIHPKYYWYLGSPDGIVAADGGVDFKTTGHRNGWGQPGTDEVPEWIHTQADWYMGLTDAEWWDIAVLFFSPRREFAIYRIPRNQELIDNLIQAGKDFWENHVIPQIPPPIDASEGSKKLLNYLYPQDKEDLLISSDGINVLAERLRDQEIKRDMVITQLTLIQNQLKEVIGDHAGIQTSLGKIKWSKNKDSEITNWQGIVMELNVSSEIIKKHTSIKPGARVFRTYWDKKREDA